MSKYLLSEKEYAEYQNMKARLKELKEENKTLKDRLIISNAEHTDYIIKTNEKIVKLRKKLKIAEEALNDIKNSFFEDEDKEIITHAESIYYYSKAQEALQEMKEANNDNNINLN